MRHVHKCAMKDCRELLDCEDDCVEGERVTLRFCSNHRAPKDWTEGVVLIESGNGVLERIDKASIVK